MVNFDVTNIQLWSLSSDGFFQLTKTCDMSLTVDCPALAQKVNQDHAQIIPKHCRKDLLARTLVLNFGGRGEPVSYTHLTLPTILLV